MNKLHDISTNLQLLEEIWKPLRLVAYEERGDVQVAWEIPYEHLIPIQQSGLPLHH